VTVEEFLERHSEFSEQEAEAVEAALDDATRRTDAEVFGTSTEEAIGWLAAHLLIAGPNGRKVRESLGKDGKSTYLDERLRLEQECAHMWIGIEDC
jgi:hypothetical protein